MPRLSFPVLPRPCGAWLVAWLAVAGPALAAEPEGAPPPAATAQLPQQAAPVAVGDLLAQAAAAAAEQRWPAAIAAWQAVLAREPARREVRQRLADALFETGRTVEARAEYQRLLGERLEAENLFRLSRLLRDSGATIDALRLAEQGQSAFPADPRFPTLRVDLLLKLGDTASAGRLAAALPPTADGQLAAGRLAEAGEQWATACRAYRAALAAGGGKPAEEGMRRCRQQAVKLGPWLIFAAPGWQAGGVPPVFRQRMSGVEMSVVAAPAGRPAEALRSALLARLPPDSLTPPLPPEDLAAFAALSAEHEAGKGNHTDAPEAAHQAVLDALQGPVALVVEPAVAGQALCARAAPRPGRESASLPPIAACLSAEGDLVYLLAGRIEAATARQWLLTALAAGRLKEE